MVFERPQTGKKTILVFSPDLNLCFSLSLLFQDRYHVVTTTSLDAVSTLVAEHRAELVIIDAVPSARLIASLDAIRGDRGNVSVVMLYVYDARLTSLDRAIRDHVDTIFYKPVDIAAVSQRIQELLQSKASV
jgi:DNA-binding NtrC family response regulator